MMSLNRFIFMLLFFVVLFQVASAVPFTPQGDMQGKNRLAISNFTDLNVTNNINFDGVITGDGSGLTNVAAGNFSFNISNGTISNQVDNTGTVTLQAGNQMIITQSGNVLTFNSTAVGGVDTHGNLNVTNTTSPISVDLDTEVLQVNGLGIITIGTLNNQLNITGVEVDGSITNELQNLWLTVSGDTGSTSANIQTDTLTIAGGGTVSTAVSGDTLTITGTVHTINTEGFNGTDGGLNFTGQVLGTNSSFLQLRVTGVCASDSFATAITQAGGVTCVVPDTFVNVQVNGDLNVTGAVTLNGSGILDWSEVNQTSVDTNETTRVETNINSIAANWTFTESINNHSPTTDTNETTRVNNAAGFSCTGTDKVSSFGTDLTPGCTADEEAAGGTGMTDLNLSNGTDGNGVSVSESGFLRLLGGENINIDLVDDGSASANYTINATDTHGNLNVTNGTDPISVDLDTQVLTINGLGINTVSTFGNVVNITGTEVDGSTTNELQDLWNTISGDSGSTTANTQTDTLTIAGGSGITTSVSGDTLTVTNDGDTDGTDDIRLLSNGTIDVTPTAAEGRITLLGNGITNIISGNNQINISSVEVDGSITNELQNLWETVSSDSGSTSANIQTDTITIVGGNAVNTSISGDILTVNVEEGNINANSSNITQNWNSAGTILGASTDIVAVGTIATGIWEGTVVTDSFVANAITVSGGTISSNNVDGTWTTTASLTIGDNGDNIVIDADNWDVSSAGAGTFITVDTGQGATEVHLMNQDLQNTNSVEFVNVNATANITANQITFLNSNQTTGAISDNSTCTLFYAPNGALGMEICI